MGWKINGDELLFNGQIVGQLEEGHIHIALGFLRDAGFKGDIEISPEHFKKLAPGGVYIKV